MNAPSNGPILLDDHGSNLVLTEGIGLSGGDRLDGARVVVRPTDEPAMTPFPMEAGRRPGRSGTGRGVTVFFSSQDLFTSRNDLAGEAGTLGSTPAIHSGAGCPGTMGSRHIYMPLTPPGVWKAIHLTTTGGS